MFFFIVIKLHAVVKCVSTFLALEFQSINTLAYMLCQVVWAGHCVCAVGTLFLFFRVQETMFVQVELLTKCLIANLADKPPFCLCLTALELFFVPLFLSLFSLNHTERYIVIHITEVSVHLFCCSGKSVTFSFLSSGLAFCSLVNAIFLALELFGAVKYLAMKLGTFRWGVYIRYTVNPLCVHILVLCMSCWQFWNMKVRDICTFCINFLSYVRFGFELQSDEGEVSHVCKVQGTHTIITLISVLCTIWVVNADMDSVQHSCQHYC